MHKKYAQGEFRMSQLSPAKVKVKGIRQIAILVRDLQRTVENYWNILGIGPWDIYAWEYPLVYDWKYHGRPAWAREKAAVAQVGPVELELVQFVEGDSVHRDFLAEHGEGLYHLSFFVDDVDDTVDILTKQGFCYLQGGCFGPSEYRGSYAYIYIKPLHAIWEPAYIGETIGGHPTKYPDCTQTSPAKVKVKGIRQVAILVRDLQATVENYWNILGIGPWDIYAWEYPFVYDRKYHGRPAWAREKLAVARVGDVLLELCQSIEGDSLYEDTLKEHGEGPFSLNFLVDDVEETTEILGRQGFPNLQSARFGPARYKNAFSYINIKPLCTIWEPARIAGSIGIEPTRYP